MVLSDWVGLEVASISSFTLQLFVVQHLALQEVIVMADMLATLDRASAQMRISVVVQFTTAASEELSLTAHSMG